MRRWLLVIGLAGGAWAPPLRAQLVAVRLEVAVGGSAVPAEPVPHFLVMLYRSTGEQEAVMTDEQGVARTSVPPGDYRVASFQAYHWRGQWFSWAVPLAVHGDSASVALTLANAHVRGRPSTGLAPGIFFATRSGRPELDVVAPDRRALVGALIAGAADAGWTLEHASDYQVVLTSTAGFMATALLGSYERRATLTLAPGADDTVRVIGSVTEIRDPGTAYQSADDITMGRAGQDLQVLLDAVGHQWGANGASR